MAAPPMVTLKSVITIAELTILPIVRAKLSNTAAILNLSAATDPMAALLLGDEKKPKPKPKNTNASIT